ncbi:hypothetical protein [Vannielia sp.]|uniref:hypothetical protein n=1 Tax=Vannielia sp. TaxID=2813045 RepID=UPI0026182B76|nr:hypothetical protein [Vannielia sp.]MDF1873535.1 hypothetical protein [Vannielia sp.]
MSKLIAIMNVIAWSGFWAFGYLALTTDPAHERRMMIAGGLAVLGAFVGIWAYLRLVRISERTGYSKPAERVLPEHKELGQE